MDLPLLPLKPETAVELLNNVNSTNCSGQPDLIAELRASMTEEGAHVFDKMRHNAALLNIEMHILSLGQGLLKPEEAAQVHQLFRHAMQKANGHAV